MEIVAHQLSGVVELEVRGTLDSGWASHLTQAIDDVVRAGSHRLLVNLNQVTYVSSAGIAVLVAAHRQLKAIQGTFGVSTPSPEALSILRLTGLEKLLVCDRDAVLDEAGTLSPSMISESRIVTSAGFGFEVFNLAPTGPLECRTIGCGDALPDRTFSVLDCQPVSFPGYTCGLGLGAFGSSFETCRERFGEFLAVAGNVAQMPGEKGAPPDYQLAREAFVPEVQVLYGAQFTTMFSKLMRFESASENRSIPLSTLVSECMTIAEAELAAVVIVAESAGLLGATLKRSPVTAEPMVGGLFEFPYVRQWLSFTPERGYARSLAVVVGIAGRGPVDERARRITPFLRPLDPDRQLFGHFHAGVFGYRPMRKGRLDLGGTTATLFEAEGLQALLHLIADRRELVGAGESEFISGGCWIGPMGDVAGEGL